MWKEKIHQEFPDKALSIIGLDLDLHFLQRASIDEMVLLNSLIDVSE